MEVLSSSSLVCERWQWVISKFFTMNLNLELHYSAPNRLLAALSSLIRRLLDLFHNPSDPSFWHCRVLHRQEYRSEQIQRSGCGTKPMCSSQPFETLADLHVFVAVLVGLIHHLHDTLHAVDHEVDYCIPLAHRRLRCCFLVLGFT